MSPILVLPLLCLSSLVLAPTGMADTTPPTSAAPVPAAEMLLDDLNSKMQQAKTLHYAAESTFQNDGAASFNVGGKALPKRFLLSVKGFAQKKDAGQNGDMLRLVVTLDGKPYRLLVQNQGHLYDYASDTNRYHVFDNTSGPQVSLKGPLAIAMLPIVAFQSEDAHALLFLDATRDFSTGTVSSPAQPAHTWKVSFAPDATAKTDPQSDTIVTMVKQSALSLDKTTGLVSHVESSWYSFFLKPKSETKPTSGGFSFGTDFSQFQLDQQPLPVSEFDWTPPKGAKEDPTLDNA